MSAQFIPLPSASRLPATLDGLNGGFLWLVGHVTRFWHAYETRRQLSELDAHLLRDIGITPMDARIEAARKPWDLQGR